MGDSQSNGEVEVTNQMVQGQVRTVKAQLEQRLGEAVPLNSDLLPWLVSHSGTTISRYHVGKDGFTSYRRLKGRAFVRPCTELGECIWYLKHKSAKRGTLQPRWADGVFLGIREESGEIIVGTPEGVLKARTFRRKGSSEERWNRDFLMSVKGIPWEPVPVGGGGPLRRRLPLPLRPRLRVVLLLRHAPGGEEESGRVRAVAASATRGLSFDSREKRLAFVCLFVCW